MERGSKCQQKYSFDFRPVACGVSGGAVGEKRMRTGLKQKGRRNLSSVKILMEIGSEVWVIKLILLRNNSKYVSCAALPPQHNQYRAQIYRSKTYDCLLVPTQSTWPINWQKNAMLLLHTQSQQLLCCPRCFENKTRRPLSWHLIR